jgi:hypothetical protein
LTTELTSPKASISQIKTQIAAEARITPRCYKHTPGTSITIHIHAELEKLETSKPKHETQFLCKASVRVFRRIFKPSTDFINFPFCKFSEVSFFSGNPEIALSV